MVRGVLLYEQVYNDLTAAVRRAKLACRRPKIVKNPVASPKADKKNPRGRPKGSKDTVPRRKKAPTQCFNLHTESLTQCFTLHPGSFDYRSATMTSSDSNRNRISEVNQYDATCIPPEIPHLEFGMYGTCEYPVESLQDPPCWELPLPC
jgi:hypothetical protein